MILLDTNVVSEMAKSEPNENVVQWLDSQEYESIYLSSVSVAEILFGLSVIPEGKRKNHLTKIMHDSLNLFENRILSFDLGAAESYADLATRARSAGLGFPTPDGYIAAIAKSNHMIVSTRDTSAFNTAGIAVINPWEKHP